MNGMELRATLRSMTLTQLRKVWAAAKREGGYKTNEAAIAYAQVQRDASDPVGMTLDLVWAVHVERTPLIKTGRKVWSQITTEYRARVEETVPDMAARAKILARILAAANE
jgi:hypothetical protein